MAVDEHLAFGPVDLEAAGGDRGDVDPAAVLADITVQHHGIAVGEVEPLGAGAGSGAPAFSRVQKALKSGMPACGERW